jgi:DNA polymerase-3 subunit delta
VRARGGRTTEMPPSHDGYKALHAAVDAKQFAPVYYLHGDDDYLKAQSLTHLLNAAVDPSTRDFNLEVRHGGDLDAETLGSFLATPPMLAERRAVVVHDVHQLKKDARQALDRYLGSPARDVLLVLVTPAGSTPDAALAKRALACAFDALAPERVRKWIVYHATNVLGVTVTDTAAELLERSVGSDLQQLSAELDKCASYAQGNAVPTEPPVVDDQVVSAIVGVRRGETASDWVDAVVTRDVHRALALLPHVLAQPKASSVVLVMTLGTHLLALQWGRARRDAGASTRQVGDEYFTYLKQTNGMTARPWGEARSLWTHAVDRWTHAELMRAIRLVCDADVALKDTRVSNDEQLMTSLLLALAGVEAAAPNRSTTGRTRK